LLVQEVAFPEAETLWQLGWEADGRVGQQVASVVQLAPPPVPPHWPAAVKLARPCIQLASSLALTTAWQLGWLAAGSVAQQVASVPQLAPEELFEQPGAT
jgi:hypothetical protein